MRQRLLALPSVRAAWTCLSAQSLGYIIILIFLSVGVQPVRSQPCQTTTRVVGANQTFVNSNCIATTGNGVNGIEAGSSSTVTNSSAITTSGSSAGGIVGTGNSALITNTGTITTTGTDAAGIRVTSGLGNRVNNSGTISVTGANSAAYFTGAPPILQLSNVLSNTGRMIAGPGAFVVLANDCCNGVNNEVQGTFDGRVMLFNATGANYLTNRGLMTISYPGAGITHLVSGRFDQTSTGTLELRADNTGLSDKIAISGPNFTQSTPPGPVVPVLGGTAALDGTLRLRLQPGLYPTTITYPNVLTAALNPVTTQFARFTASSPFFSVIPTYDSGNPSSYFALGVTLTRIPFNAVPGITGNERAFANALEAGYSTNLTGVAASFYGNLLASTATVPFAALTGDGTSGTQTTALYAGNLFLSALMDQRAALRDTLGIGSVTAFSDEPPSYAAQGREHPAFKAMSPRPAAERRTWHTWYAGFGGLQALDGNSTTGAGPLTQRTGGGAAGLDVQARSDLLLGVAVGGSSSAFAANAGATTGRLTAGHAGVYVVADLSSFYAAGAVGYARIDNETSRTISGVGPTETARGIFASDQVGGRLEIGRKLQFGPSTVTPFAALQFSELWQRGYAEYSTTLSGTPGMLGLTYAARSRTSLPTSVGAQVDTRVQFNDEVSWSPFARFAWVHEFMRDRAVTATLSALAPVAAFTAQGAQAAGDSLKADVGSQLAVGRGISVFSTLTTELSAHNTSLSGSGGIKITW